MGKKSKLAKKAPGTKVRNSIATPKKTLAQKPHVPPAKFDPHDPEPMLQAAKVGDANKVAEFLAAGVDRNICHPTSPLTDSERGAFEHMTADQSEFHFGEGNDHFGWTALHVASRYGHIEIVRQLIAAGADVNAANKYGERPLHRALYVYDKDLGQPPVPVETRESVVKLLIEAGADVNALTCAEGTLLHYAMAVKDGVRLVEILVEAGADIHAHGALHDAIDANMPKVVKVMLTADKVYLKRKRNRRTPLELARHLNHRQIIKLLERAEKKK
jgi:ankyrin repeat protein